MFLLPVTSVARETGRGMRRVAGLVVVAAMAGVAVGRRAGEDAILMAGLAGQAAMAAFELEE